MSSLPADVLRPVHERHFNARHSLLLFGIMLIRLFIRGM